MPSFFLIGYLPISKMICSFFPPPPSSRSAKPIIMQLQQSQISRLWVLWAAEAANSTGHGDPPNVISVLGVPAIIMQIHNRPMEENWGLAWTDMIVHYDVHLKCTVFMKYQQYIELKKACYLSHKNARYTTKRLMNAECRIGITLWRGEYFFFHHPTGWLHLLVMPSWCLIYLVLCSRCTIASIHCTLIQYIS